MRGIRLEERKALGALLERRSQEEVMGRIPQFWEAESGHFAAPPGAVPEFLGVLMFNMERGVHLAEIQDFLRDCPDIRPLDLILANELDDGCARSGSKTPPGSWQRPWGSTTPGAWSSSSWRTIRTRRASTETPCFPAGLSAGRG